MPFHRSSEDEVRVAVSASGPPDWITRPVGRQDLGPPARPAMRRMPGVQARLILGTSGLDRTVPSASRPSGEAL